MLLFAFASVEGVDAILQDRPAFEILEGWGRLVGEKGGEASGHSEIGSYNEGRFLWQREFATRL